MELFDKRFVHFMWDDYLKGKVGFFADSIDDLIKYVEHNNRIKGEVIGSDGYHHFVSDSDQIWTFFYCDPLYEYKWVHEHEQEKKVQIKLPLSDWTDMPKDWAWDYSMKYRIVDVEEKKPERLTYKQLAMWLAKGNGQAMNKSSACVYTDNHHNPAYEDTILSNDWRVRKWDDEWREPTREYCFPETISPTPDEIGG